MKETTPGDAPIVRRSLPPDRGPEVAQPRWRRDFPVDWDEADYVSRRDLVRYMVLVSAAFAVGQLSIVIRSWLRRPGEPLPALPVAALEELPVGGAKTFTYPDGSTPRLLIRTGERAFVAYDQQCTHLQCPLVPAVERGKLHCPCHNGWFDLMSGEPVAGPPRRRLPRVVVEVRDQTVYATDVEDSA